MFYLPFYTLGPGVPILCILPLHQPYVLTLVCARVHGGSLHWIIEHEPDPKGKSIPYSWYICPMRKGYGSYEQITLAKEWVGTLFVTTSSVNTYFRFFLYLVDSAWWDHETMVLKGKASNAALAAGYGVNLHSLRKYIAQLKKKGFLDRVCYGKYKLNTNNIKIIK